MLETRWLFVHLLVVIILNRTDNVTGLGVTVNCGVCDEVQNTSKGWMCYITACKQT